MSKYSFSYRMFTLFVILAVSVSVLEGQFSPTGSLATCPNVAVPSCDINKRYSEVDGSCNNIAFPWAGKAASPYKRYLANTYDDGWNAARRTASNGAQLQNPRIISRMISLDRGQTENSYTHLLPLFGQFLAHDLTLAQTATDSNGNGLNCNCGSTLADCLSFTVPSNDNILKQACMTFTRTQNSFPTFNCGQKTREQLNSLSAFIDASQVYGMNSNINSQLRAGTKGLLKVSQGIFASRPYLPLSATQICGGNFQACFLGGETRTNENLGLVGLQVLFLREHNRIATALSGVNPSWSDETLYKETRKIVIAIMQHIIYNEWLPMVVGRQYTTNAGLNPVQGDGFFQGYNYNTNPSIANEFATAAFRFGHTLIRQQFSRYSSSGSIVAASLNISQTIFKTVEAYNTQAQGEESIFTGLLNDPAAKYDSNLVDTLQNHLFEFTDSQGVLQAFDLLALNINRGRDHGIATYAQVRTACGLKQATSFQDLLDVMPQSNIDMLKTVYSNVNDIDYYPGGLMETPIQGGAVGPTFACIIANQFKDLKTGDRFFYENPPSGWSSASAFSLAQLHEIKKMTMARVICNDYDVGQIQPNPFLLPTVSGNQRISCNNFPQLDITIWRV